MANLNIEKRNDALPATLSANTLYMVKTGSVVKVYLTDATGTVAIPLNGNTPEIEPFLLMGVNNG